MNIFRLQLMVELLKEMEVAIPEFEVTGFASEDCDDESVEVTRVIKAFNLDDWTDALGEYSEMEVPSCGYSACAVGHAMFDTRFNALGLGTINGCPLYHGKQDWEAVEAFFDVSGDVAHLLFSPDYYDDATPGDIAKRVQYLINNGAEILLAQDFD